MLSPLLVATSQLFEARSCANCVMPSHFLEILFCPRMLAMALAPAPRIKASVTWTHSFSSAPCESKKALKRSSAVCSGHFHGMVICQIGQLVHHHAMPESDRHTCDIIWSASGVVLQCHVRIDKANMTDQTHEVMFTNNRTGLVPDVKQVLRGKCPW